MYTKHCYEEYVMPYRKKEWNEKPALLASVFCILPTFILWKSSGCIVYIYRCELYNL